MRWASLPICRNEARGVSPPRAPKSLPIHSLSFPQIRPRDALNTLRWIPLGLIILGLARRKIGRKKGEKHGESLEGELRPKFARIGTPSP